MTQGTAGPIARESPREACAPSSRLIRGGGRFWLVLVAVAVVAGGRLQLELAGRHRRRTAPSHASSVHRYVRLAPCTSKGAGNSCTGERQGASGRAP